MNSGKVNSGVGNQLQSEFHESEESHFTLNSTSYEDKTMSGNEHLFMSPMHAKSKTENEYPPSKCVIQYATSKHIEPQKKNESRYKQILMENQSNASFMSSISHQISSCLDNNYGKTEPKLSQLDKPMYAPPPILPSNVNEIQTSKSFQPETTFSPLPSFDKITHSGHVMARISKKSLFTKKWKQV